MIWKSCLINGLSFIKQLGKLTQIILTSLLLITFFVAIVSPPNNLDSLSYHLSRLGYWIQNKSVEHYASHIIRSISFSPFSEYVHLHNYLLTGSDRFLQLLQWFCLLGILMYVSLLVEIFSGSIRAMRIALCFAATIPIVVLESMTTQNDLVVSFFIIGVSFYVFDYLNLPKRSTVVLISASVALGIMTKGTFVFYVAPFGIYLITSLFRKGSWKIFFLLGTYVIILTLLLNVPFWFRTNKIFDSPIGTISNGNRNALHTPAAIVSSVSKHLFLQLGFISPGNRYNLFLEKQLIQFHSFLGIPLNADGMGMTFKMNKLNFNEDFANNFLATWIILISLIIMLFQKSLLIVRCYLILTIASIVLFCTFIGYQIYGSRLHIPFFILIAPVIGVIYGSFSTYFQKILLFVLWINALPFSLLSATHPLLSTSWFFNIVFPMINKHIGLQIQPEKQSNLMQESVVFNSGEQMIWGELWPAKKSIQIFADSIHAERIGFYFDEASYDYGYQYILRKRGRQFAHVAVQNPSYLLEKRDFNPDFIIADIDAGDRLFYNGIYYIKEYLSANTMVYVPEKSGNGVHHNKSN
ncbi:glycosyltransferase family 39 protein [Dyadobacter sp. CY312]|uniref:glycosyltransferase family 39 protein n=1 Tax=Dyadobacter sp. CY312 TaxID=2907303 RepID=UPI001F27D007|nr:glycosyltransferase family 39 protein [Dyadobacter sp. CY312]MCE7042234.1 glycosyltransferase family 39 protein [Dyadobacter sp. CY312]